MANRDIIARMHKVLDAYEAAELRPEQVEQSIQFHMEALESLPYERIKDADTLCYRLVTSHLSDGEDEYYDDEEVAVVLKDFRCFLETLPGGRAG